MKYLPLIALSSTLIMSCSTAEKASQASRHEAFYQHDHNAHYAGSFLQYANIGNDTNDAKVYYKLNASLSNAANTVLDTNDVAILLGQADIPLATYQGQGYLSPEQNDLINTYAGQTIPINLHKANKAIASEAIRVPNAVRFTGHYYQAGAKLSLNDTLTWVADKSNPNGLVLISAQLSNWTDKPIKGHGHIKNYPSTTIIVPDTGACCLKDLLTDKRFTASQGIEITITRRNDVVLKDDKGNDYLYSINITSEMNGVML